MNRSTRRALLTAIIIAASMHVIVGAQAQIGQNINVITGINDPTTGDPFRQRHNESVIAISGVNSDHMVVAYNDYSMVDIANDQDVGTPSPAQSAVARLFDMLLKPWRGDRRDTKRRVENVDKASANAWMGWSFSDNGGKNWVRGLHHGHPFEASSPLGAVQLKGYNFQAASDPVLAATHDKFYLGGIAFTPNGGSAGFVSVLTDYNDTETGRNIRYDVTKILLSTPTATYFVDKPSIAALGNNVYAAFVVFDESDQNKLSSKILFFRSTDQGATWSAGSVISDPLTRNQAPWILVDPNNANTVYIGWRVFSAQTGGLSNAIVGNKSINGGVSWLSSSPWPVATVLKAFDQPQGVLDLNTNPPRLPIPRSNAYPSATIDGNGTIHLALQEWVHSNNGTPLGGMSPPSNGLPRITLTSSYNGGLQWTGRKAIDFGPESGTQFMPVITAVGEPGTSCPGFTGPRSRVMVMYYDARASTKTGYVAGGGRQFDVRIAEAGACNRDQSGRLLFSPSKQLSQYSLDPTQYSLDPTDPRRIVKTPGYGYTAVNRAYSMFGGGTKAFTGDYIGLTPRVPYVNTPSGWKLTTAKDVDRDKLPAPVVQGVWPDTRTAVLPTNPGPTLPPTDPYFVDSMAWYNYQPPHTGKAPNQCFNAGARSQDVFTAEYAPNGLFAAAPKTFRISAAPKPYPLYVENRFPSKRFFRLTIDQAAEASFNYKTFTPANTAYDRSADVEIGPFSTVTGTVVVGAAVSSPVAITIAQITALGGTEVAGGAKTAVTLNSAGPATNTESHDPVVQQTPTVSRPFEGTNVLPRQAGPTNPLPSPYTDNPYTDNPYTDNPYTDNVTVYDVIDATVDVTNGGDATASYAALVRLQNSLALQGNYVFQTFIYRVAKNPALNGCQTIERFHSTQVSTIKAPYTDNPYTDNPYTDNPYTDNPYTDNASPEDASVTNSTFYLAPENSTQTTDGTSAPRPVDIVRFVLRASQIKLSSDPTFVPFNPATQFSLTVVPETPNVIQLPGGGVGFDPGGATAVNSGSGVAVKLAFDQQPPASVGRGHTFTVKVAVQDANGALVANSTRPVTIALGGNSSGATLSGTLTKNAAGGIATFDDLSVDKIQNGYTLVASSSGVASATSAAFDVTKSILIYGPSLESAATTNERTIAEANGYTVTVKDAAAWSSMTSTDFGKYNAIVFGDPGCIENPSPLGTADANKATWSSLITGPIVLIGTDPVFHFAETAAAVTLTANAINFAASGTATGMYMSLSCYYHTAPPGTQVAVLSQFGTFNVTGANANTVTVNEPAHEVMSGLTSTSLSNWFNSMHEWFSSFPDTWRVLASETSTPTSPRPYILTNTPPVVPVIIGAIDALGGNQRVGGDRQ